MSYEQAAVAAAHAHITVNGASIIDEFLALLSLPNVSADLDDVSAVAAYVAGQMTARGIEPMVIERPGVAPIVSGRIHVSDDAPTVGIYAHYDGQPVDSDQWETPPFSPTLVGSEGAVRLEDGDVIDEDWRVFARSSSDDKAPIQALLSAWDALVAAGIEPSVNIVLLFEGQEEAGSPDLEDYLRENEQWFTADVWLICDGPVHQTGRPQIIFGVRGIAQMDLTVYGPLRGLHSGHYGNWVPSPTWNLVQLLATMRDPDGDALIDGFYDDVVAPSHSELAAIAEMPPYEDELLAEIAVRTAEGKGESLVERMYRPSLNLRGFEAGPTGKDAANVLPESATASLDIRLPPNHDPEEVLDRIEAHIRMQGFHVVHDVPDASVRSAHDKVILVARDPHYTGMRVPIESPEGGAVIAAAVAASGGAEVVAVPTLGGSVPIVHFANVLGCPTIIAPIANHDNNQHDANENIRIGNLFYGIRLMAALMTMGPSLT